MEANAICFFVPHHIHKFLSLPANQNFANYASEADFMANPSSVYGSFGLDPLNNRRTYNRVIVKNVQTNKDIWIAVIAVSGDFNGVAINF